MATEPLVTVICLTYNHEPYIRDALEGFVSQKTTFPFEVIVHDDASTDGTAAVIREYEQRYPEIIKPIYQKENQYSQRVGIMKDFVLPNSHGKYVALCEGDDYWTDPNKLQMQADFLETHAGYSACAHLTRVLDLWNYYRNDAGLFGDRYETFSPDDGGGQDVPMELLLQGGGSGFHTSSMMFQKTVYTSLPAFYHACPGVGDYPLRIYLALLGRVYRFNAVCSTYRMMVPGSWTMRTRTVAQQIATLDSFITMLEQVDSYAEGRYADAIKRSIQDKQITILLLKKRYPEIRRNAELRHIFDQYPLKARLGLIVGNYFPWAKTLYHKLPAVNRLYNSLWRKNTTG